MGSHEARARMEAWPDPVAVAQAARLLAHTIDDGARQLTDLRRLEQATLDLERALAHEERADADEAQTAGQVRMAGRGLRAAVSPRLEVAEAALVRAGLSELVMRWSDPYASDSTGAPLLAQMRRHLQAAGEGTHDLWRALEAVEAAGPAHDHASWRRARAIDARVEARRTWNRAALRVFEHLGAAAGHRWLEAAPTQAAEAFSEDAWFDCAEE